MHHTCRGEICRGDCLAGTVHMEICSHFFLCAIPFTNGNDCFIASSHSISFPWDVKLGLGEIPQWLGLKPSLCHRSCSTRKGEQGGSKAGRTLPLPACLSRADTPLASARVGQGASRRWARRWWRGRAEVELGVQVTIGYSAHTAYAYTIYFYTAKYGGNGEAPAQSAQGNKSLLVPSCPWHPCRAQPSSGEGVE